MTYWVLEAGLSVPNSHGIIWLSYLPVENFVLRDVGVSEAPEWGTAVSPDFCDIFRITCGRMIVVRNC